MNLSTQYRGDRLAITVEGHITSIKEVSQINDILSATNDYQAFELNILDAFVMPSALIGQLVTLTNKYNKSITIIPQHNELKELLEDLNLHEVFDIR